MDNRISEKDFTLNEKLSQGILDHLPLMIAKCNPEGKFYHFNKKWKNTTGEPFSTGDFLNVFAEQHKATIGKYFYENLQNRTPFELKTITARYTSCKINGQPVFDDASEFTGYLLMVTESEEKSQDSVILNAILDKATIGIHMLRSVRDVNGDIIDFRWILANREATDFLNMRNEEIRDKSILEIYPPDLYKQYFSRFKSVVATGESDTMEFQIDKEGVSNFFVFHIHRFQDGLLLIRDNVTKNILSERSLQEKDHLIKQIALSTPDIIQIYDLIENRNVYVNKEAYELMGYTLEDTKAMGTGFIKTLVHPDDVHIIVSRNEKFKTATDGEVIITNHRIKHKNGTWRWVNSKGVIFKRTENGEAWQYLSVVRDITEQISTEEELRKAKEELTSLNLELEAKIKERTSELIKSEFALKEAQRLSKVGNWDFEIKTGSIKWSDEIFRIHELNPSDGEPDFPTLLSYYPDPSKLPYYVEKAIKEGQPYQYDDMIITPSGNKKIIQIIGHPVMQDGECVRLFGTTMDITERKKVEDALSRSETNLRVITDALPALIAKIDPEGRFVFANKSYCEYHGKSQDEIIGKQVSEILSEQGYNKIKTNLDRAMHGERVSSFVEIQNAKGELRYLNSEYIPVWDQNGQQKGFIALVIDVTDLKKIQTELSEKNKELIHINTDLDNFVYTASHDLKAPVSNIEGLVYTLEDVLQLEGNISKDQQMIFEMIRSSINRFKTTIQELSEISKLQKSGKTKSDEVDISNILENISIHLRTDIEKSGANIILINPENIKVNFSRKDLNSVLYNLVSNAIKYRSPERNPEIKIEISETNNEEIQILVSDNGLGIPNGKTQDIFGMYKRFHSHVEGSGVGLYIVRRIIDLAGGRIEVESEEEKGTCFRLFFPKK